MGVKVKEKTQGSGVWWVFINHNGRRKSKRVGSEKAARKVAEMIEARLKLGQAVLPEERPALPTLDKYFKKFQETYLETGGQEINQGQLRIELPALLAAGVGPAKA